MTKLGRKIQKLLLELKQWIFMHGDQMKPNFSALAREYGLSRQTVAKHYYREANGNQPEKKPRKARASQFDPYHDEIKALFDGTTCSIQSVFKFLQNKYNVGVFKSYDSFKAYVRSKNFLELRRECCNPKSHVRVETGRGEQVQLDWKENLKMELKTGEIIDFNIFTAVSSYSRFTDLVYSKTKTTEDFIRCLIQVTDDFGGVPDGFLTDNMSAVVQVTGGGRRKLPQIIQLEKDMEAKINLCKPKKPQTKGKVESANRMISWLEPYQGKLNSEQELIDTVKIITRQINEEACETTGIPRKILFKKEKEYFRPLPNPIILDSYIKDIYTQTVPSTLLVQYKGKGYSVPKSYIGKRVKVIPIDDNLQIYYNNQFICSHKITEKAFNYHPEHYKEGLMDGFSDKQKASPDFNEAMDKQVTKNLALLDTMKHKSK